MDHDYDVAVIGAGPAGEKAATKAAYFGKRVALIDDLGLETAGVALGRQGRPTVDAWYVTRCRGSTRWAT